MTRSPTLNAFAAGLCSAGAAYFAVAEVWPMALLVGLAAVANVGSLLAVRL
jgi:hypothetical protein